MIGVWVCSWEDIPGTQCIEYKSRVIIKSLCVDAGCDSSDPPCLRSHASFMIVDVVVVVVNEIKHLSSNFGTSEPRHTRLCN
jgi:hypothetical protein